MLQLTGSHRNSHSFLNELKVKEGEFIWEKKSIFLLKQDTDMSYRGIVFITTSCMYLYFIITCENKLELFRESLNFKYCLLAMKALSLCFKRNRVYLIYV